MRGTVVRVKLFSDIGHVMAKIDWEELTLRLKNMTTYERVKPATAGPVANINKLKMICLFYFVLESEKIAIKSGLQWYLKNYSIFPLFVLFFISIPNVNSN